MLRRLLATGLMLTGCAVQAEPPALVGILQGSAVLVRQTTRYALAEGVALGEGDIVETPAGAFVQIEFDDGAIVALGESSRAILKPRLSGLKTVGSPRLYLLEGWLKISLKSDMQVEFDVLAPPLELAAKGGAVVMRVQPKSYAVFAERGSASLVPREGARAVVALKSGDFVAHAPISDKPTLSARLDPEFTQQLPRPFRDPLPARAALFAKHAVVPQALGQVAYADVTTWLHSEPGVRIALSKQWRSRASDRAFRAELVANLSAHMEWERVLYPERFLPKKPLPMPAGAASEPVSLSN
jgi:hypothetical protein